MPKIGDPVRAEGKGHVRVVGTFFPAGTGTPTVTTATGGVSGTSGVGWSVSRTAAGTFLITFNEKYPCILSKTAGVQHTTAVDLKAQYGDFSASAGTLVLRLVAVATATDMAANANNSVSFDVTFSTHAKPL